jgi:hypothetical protein
VRSIVTLVVLAVALGCGEPPAPSALPPGPSTAGPSPSISTAPPPPTSGSPSPTDPPSPAADPAACERVRPCIEAFVAVAPESLAAPARTALEQVDQSLGESPARAAACRGALDSYRHDLEQAGLEVPEACR